MIVVRLERAEAVAEARRYPQLIVVRGRQRHRKPSTIRRRIRPKVDDHVDELAGETANKFPLGSRMTLEMEAANSAPPHAHRLIILNEFDAVCVFSELVQPECLREVAPFVFNFRGMSSTGPSTSNVRNSIPCPRLCLGVSSRECATTHITAPSRNSLAQTNQRECK